MGIRATLSNRWKPLLLVLGLVAALALPAAGGAETLVKEVEMVKPFTFFGFNPCREDDPTPIELEGQQHILLHIRKDSSGGTHITLAVDTHGSGADLTFPFEKYSIADRIFFEINIPAPTTEATQILYTRVVRAGEQLDQTDDLFLRTHFHVTINANSVPTAEVARTTVECR